MFNLDETDGIVRNLQLLHDQVDEIVIVDNSADKGHQELLHQIRPYGAGIFRAIPLGYPEPLRPYGLSKIRSEYVLQLDADEEPSKPLIASLRGLTRFNAYVVPRYEVGLRSFTYHVRLFKRISVTYAGASYAYPQVRGTVGRLDKELHIVHHANFSTYLREKSRGKRYFAIESFERPFTGRYLMETLVLRLGQKSVGLPLLAKFIGVEDEPLTEPVVRAAISCTFIRDILLGKGLRAARFFRQYDLARYRYFKSLSETEKGIAIAISRKLREQGGVAEFLCLENASYVEGLTDHFRWDKEGIEVLNELLHYKFETGVCKEVIGP